MADTKTSALTAASALAGTEPIPVVQSGATKRSTPAAIKTYVETGGTVTASDPVLDLTQTWNNAAVTFTGLKLDVTNTASASASKVAALQIGGVNSVVASISGSVHVFDAFTDDNNYSRLALNPKAAGDWVQIAAETAGTEADNYGIALTPAGTGAISAQVPDSTTAGGNARGNCATDFQMIRSAATQVASGSYAGILSGYYNTASGSRSVIAGGDSNQATATATGVVAGTNNRAQQVNAFVGGGNGNIASNTDSVVAGGGLNTASGYRSWIPGGGNALTRGLDYTGAYAASFRAAKGDAQVILQPVRRTTTDATPVSLATDGTPAATTVMVLPANSTLMVTAIVAARDASGNSAGWIAQALFKRDGSGNTTRLGTATVTAIGTPDAAINTATIDIVANDTLESAEIQVTGVAATTIYWVGELKCVQVA